MKKFFILWSSQAASMFGSAVVQFALVWHLTTETGSATVLATAMMVAILPGVIAGPFIGPLIDRWNRKKIIILSDLATALLTVVLVVLFYTDTIQIWHIYLVMAGRAISASFQQPALSASIPMIVPEQHLTRANGLNMTLQGAINIVGPPVGAFLIETLEMQLVFSVDIVTAVIAVGCLLPLSIPQPQRTTLSIKSNVIGDMVQGFRYITARRGLMLLLLLISGMSFFSAPGNSLVPIFVTKHLGGDVFKLGWLQTARGCGVVLGGLVLGIWGGFRRRIITSFTFIAIQAVAIAVFSFTTEPLFLMGIAMVFIAGICGVFIGGPIMAIFQSVVARDAQGRFFALMGSITGAMMPLGLAVCGPVADAIGVRAVLFITAAAIFALTAAGFFSRDLMNIENKKVGEIPETEIL